MKLQRLINTILGKPTLSINEVITDAIGNIQNNDRLNNDEKLFIEKLYLLVQEEEEGFNYQEYARSSPSDNIEFWYETAVAMMILPNKKDYDIRDIGRLYTAHTILTRILEHSHKIAPFWAQKIEVLDYLATGHAEKNQTQKKDTIIQQILDATSQACIYFPNEQWFSDKRQAMLNKYGN
ncbi:MAG: hypothetical protein KGV50_03845 [Gammaproteobacteria bacterium]|nr:hypothetical protein [Gammaproteobacteria bacterium]